MVTHIFVKFVEDTPESNNDVMTSGQNFDIKKGGKFNFNTICLHIRTFWQNLSRFIIDPIKTLPYCERMLYFAFIEVKVKKICTLLKIY